MENKRIPFSEASDEEFKKLVENSAQGNTKLFSFRTISQPWALSSDIPAAERALFTKYFAAKVTRYVHVSENVHTTTALNSLH